jgi:pantetheine-phosphate adenylyltransferase
MLIMYKKAIYPGSFDPFTNGHMDIVRKASKLFEEVYIVIGVNIKKNRSFDVADIKKGIISTLKQEGIKNCRVVAYNGLVAEFAKNNDIKYMVRGLRNNMDYNYEESIAGVNKLICPELEYVYFRAENVSISSSMVRELVSFGHSISEYVPKSIAKIMDSKNK